MKPIRLELSQEMFAALGCHTEGGRSPLSPLSPPGLPTPAVDSQLVQAGVLNSQNHLLAPFNDLLSSLAIADVRTEFVWNGPSGQKEFSFYTTQMPVSSAVYMPTLLAFGNDDHLILRSPASFQDLVDEVKPLVEIGAPSNPSLDIHLSPKEATLLVLLVDLDRQVAALAKKNPSPKRKKVNRASWSSARLLEGLQSSAELDKSLWVFTLLALNILPKKEWCLSDLQEQLDCLVRAGLVCSTGEDLFALSDPLSVVINRFALFDKSFWLSVDRAGLVVEESDTPSEEYFGFCSQGLNLIFSFSNGGAALRTLSVEQIVAIATCQASSRPIFVPERAGDSSPVPAAMLDGQDKTILAHRPATILPVQDATVPSMRPPTIPIPKSDQAEPAYPVPPQSPPVQVPLPALKAPQPVKATPVRLAKKKVPTWMIVGLALTILVSCGFLAIGGGLLLIH